jgi:hypothetical protein
MWNRVCIWNFRNFNVANYCFPAVVLIVQILLLTKQIVLPSYKQRDEIDQPLLRKHSVDAEQKLCWTEHKYLSVALHLPREKLNSWSVFNKFHMQTKVFDVFAQSPCAHLKTTRRESRQYNVRTSFVSLNNRATGGIASSWHRWVPVS